MNISYQDNLEALTRATDHLIYVEQVIDSFELGDKLRKRLTDHIGFIRQRLNDQNLYMAVVGGASTGKSTFINALLKQQLLESRALTMTTTASTVIQAGEQLEIEVSFYPSSDARGLVQTATFTAADEPITLIDLPGIQNFSLTDLIVYLTTSDDIAQRLVSIKVTHPAQFLQEGICIVDTPGADATQVEHLQITREAVAQSDAAIIITPAKQIVSDALLNMIVNELQLMPFLHRCIFLITGMDLIRQRERERLIQATRQRLMRGLNLEDEQALPPVLYASAQAVVDGFSADDPIVDPAERDYWQAQFQHLEGELFSRLKQQRALTVAEAVLRLLDDLFAALEADLEQQWEQQKAERVALETAVIPDLAVFAQQQHDECEDRMADLLDETLIWAESAVTRRRDRVIEKVEVAIKETTSLNELKTFVDEELSDLLTRQQQKLQKKVSDRFDKLYRKVQEIRQVFDERFTEAYQRLSVIQQRNLNSGDWAKVTIGADDLVTSASGSGALAGVALQQRVKGAAIAVLVSAVVLPGLGLLLPAILGSLFSGFFGPSLAQRQEQLLEEIRPKLVDQFLDVGTAVRKATRTYHQQLQEAIDEHIDEHVARYSQTVQAMREEQQAEVARLTQLQATLAQLKTELSQRRDRIRAQMKVLSAIAI